MTHEAARPSLEILLVEDNPGDVRLTREAFARRQGPQRRCTWSPTACEALAFLRRRGRVRRRAPRPT